jgi:ketosteroid isomerase-like protein
MSWIVEDVTWLIALGIVVEAILAVVLFRTGRGAVMFLVAGVLALVLAGVVVERLIVTEREEVEQTLDALTAALKSGDLPAVLDHLAPEASYARDMAQTHLPQVKISEARVRNLDITINPLTSPPTAEARFRGIMTIKDLRGQFPYEHYLQRFTVHFRREGDRWLLVDYESQAIEGNNFPWEQQRQ